MAKLYILLIKFLTVLILFLLPTTEHWISNFYQLLLCHCTLISTRAVPNLEGRYTSSDVPQSCPPPVQVEWHLGGLFGHKCSAILPADPRHQGACGGCAASSQQAEHLQLGACLSPGVEKPHEVLLARFSLRMFPLKFIFILEIVC